MPEKPITLEDDDDSFHEAVEIERLDEVVFNNVSEVILRHQGILTSLGADLATPFSIHLRAGSIVCLGVCPSTNLPSINLQGGSLLPPTIAFGPALGLTEIIAERSTSDAPVFDPLMHGELSRAQQVWGPRVAVRAVDGLAFGGKHLRIARGAGVGKAVTAPLGDGFFRGVSVVFRTGAVNGASIFSASAGKEADGFKQFWREERSSRRLSRYMCTSAPRLRFAVLTHRHRTIGHYKGTQMPSISTEIAELRGLLLGGLRGDAATSEGTDYFTLVAKGEIPLVINAWKADVIATLILLKKEVERTSISLGGKKLKWVMCVVLPSIARRS